MKKLTAIIAAFAVSASAFAFVGCGGSDDGSDIDPNNYVDTAENVQGTYYRYYQNGNDDPGWQSDQGHLLSGAHSYLGRYYVLSGSSAKLYTVTYQLEYRGGPEKKVVNENGTYTYTLSQDTYGKKGFRIQLTDIDGDKLFDDNEVCIVHAGTMITYELKDGALGVPDRPSREIYKKAGVKTEMPFVHYYSSLKKADMLTQPDHNGAYVVAGNVLSNTLVKNIKKIGGNNFYYLDVYHDNFVNGITYYFDSGKIGSSGKLTVVAPGKSEYDPTYDSYRWVDDSRVYYSYVNDNGNMTFTRDKITGEMKDSDYPATIYGKLDGRVLALFTSAEALAADEPSDVLCALYESEYVNTPSILYVVSDTATTIALDKYMNKKG